MKFPEFNNTDNSNESLCEIVRQRIAAGVNKRITFAEYMDLVLYHPQHGYYATEAVNIGKQGDFLTSPHWGTDFGELLATQFLQMWEILQRPHPFTIVEMGAGQGILAANILECIQERHGDFFDSLEYVIVEKSAAMKSVQKENLKKWLPANKLQWREWEKIGVASITGCFFSNELFDSFPVHQIMVEGGKIQEIYVTGDGNKFVEVSGEISTPKIADYFPFMELDLLSGAYADGYRTEVNLLALDWAREMSSKLQKGYALTIDYGYSAERYYNPGRREGTLQCYFQHRRHNNPYWNVGRQDITAHVNFTAIDKISDWWGLMFVDLTQQGLFLMALGLGDRLNELSSDRSLSITDVLRRREALHSLIDPMGLGGFGVLVQSKGLSEEEEGIKLKGLTMP